MNAARETAAIKIDRKPAKNEFPAQNHDERGDFSNPISEACQKAISMFAFAIENFAIFLGRSSTRVEEIENFPCRGNKKRAF